MTFFAELSQRVTRVNTILGEDIAAGDIPAALSRCDDATVVELIREASAIVKAGEVLRIAASGVAAKRSDRDRGHGGLAQARGHRCPVSLVQEITGATRAEATRQVRLGTALVETALVERGGEAAESQTAELGTAAEVVRPWHAPLGDALLAGDLTAAQHDAILRGLGEPPVTPGDDVASAQGGLAWSLAAEQLIAEARERTVEELLRTARTVRDQLDPEGAQRRFDERFDRRSLRLWIDPDGLRRGSIVFDDLGGTWAQTILDAALRPRRGGPRFVDPAAKALAEDLVADPRSNDQLAYDLFLDVLRAGALADAKTVFGTRQAGVRVLVTSAAFDAVACGEPAVGVVEDDQTALPAWLIGQQVCNTGTIECTVDSTGNPLDLGREARLYSSRQRVTLAVRDGGCRWRGCDRPASYCEAHHIDDYAKGGCTDVDRGISLCRFHHMQLHHGGWRITRAGRGDFILHPPPGRGDPLVLSPRLGRRHLWGDIDPPPKRFRPAA